MQKEIFLNYLFLEKKREIPVKAWECTLTVKK